MDREKILYDEMLVSLRKIFDRVGESSTLSTEVNNLRGAVSDLGDAWKSVTSTDVQRKLDNVNKNLSDVRTKLNQLIEKVEAYSKYAKEIDQE